MALDFPNSPTVGQIFNTADRDWKWSGTRWESYGTTPGAGGGGCFADVAPPSNPNVGDLWYDTNTGKMYIWYDSVWSEVSGSPATDIPVQAGRNVLVNGSLAVTQRGTAAVTGGFLGADQWSGLASGAVSPSFGPFSIAAGGIPGYPDTEPLRNYLEISGTLSAPTGSGYIFIASSVEDVRTIVGPAVLSFWARTDTPGSMNIRVDQQYDASTAVQIHGQSLAVSTSWQRFIVPITFPSLVGKTLNNTTSKINVKFDKNLGTALGLGTANITGFLRIAGVQLERGTVATPFDHKSYAEDLRACQRYLWVAVPGGLDCQIPVMRYAATGCTMNLFSPVPMRIQPTLSVLGGGFGRLVFYQNDGLWNPVVAAPSGIFYSANSPALSHHEINIIHPSMSQVFTWGSFDTAGVGTVVVLSAEL